MGVPCVFLDDALSCGAAHGTLLPNSGVWCDLGVQFVGCGPSCIPTSQFISHNGFVEDFVGQRQQNYRVSDLNGFTSVALVDSETVSSLTLAAGQMNADAFGPSPTCHALPMQPYFLFSVTYLNT